MESNPEKQSENDQIFQFSDCFSVVHQNLFQNRSTDILLIIVKYLFERSIHDLKSIL